MAMKTMSTGQAIIERVLAHGVDTVFGLPGAQTYPLFDAMAQAGDRVRLIGVRHEQATAFYGNGICENQRAPRRLYRGSRPGCAEHCGCPLHRLWHINAGHVHYR